MKPRDTGARAAVKRRAMTERQVWAELAERAEADSVYCGLCVHLDDIGDIGGIGLVVFAKVSARIDRAVKLHPCECNGSYSRHGIWAWPLTPEGRAARVAFCRRQIVRIDRAKRGKR